MDDDSPHGFHEHEDRRGVLVRMWTLDLLDGDLPSALLLNQLLWWHQPSLDGTPRAKYERAGYRWLLRADDGWFDECRMTTKQVRRARAVLLAKGLIEHRRFKLNGAPTSAWRPVFEAIRPNLELPLEGQFQGSDPQEVVGSDPRGAVPSDPPGAVPSSLPREVEVPEVTTRPVEVVFNAWLASTKKTARTVLDSKRRSVITAALRTHPLDDVLDAVRGWEHSPHHRGENAERKVWNDLGLLLRDAGRIEQFRDLARGPRLNGKPASNGFRPVAVDDDRSAPSRVLRSEDL